MEFDRALSDLFTSRVRLKILSIFLLSPQEMFYVRQVTRMADEEVNAVRRELERLKEIGLLKTENRGNRLYYQVRTDFLYYYDLLRMMGKTTGLGRVLIQKREELGKLSYATLSIAFLKGKTSTTDIDLLLVGKVNLEILQDVVRSFEQRMNREINYTVMTEDEFAFRKDRGDAFVKSVLAQPQVVLVGDEEVLNQL